jgi:hypothetical protein
MKKLALLGFAAAMMATPASVSAGAPSGEASATNICRYVQTIVIEGEFYDHYQCVIYTSGLI